MKDSHFWSTLCVGAFFGRQSLGENRQWCSLHRRGWFAARGQTVRDLGQG
jgi:hypothetical protein